MKSLLKFLGERPSYCRNSASILSLKTGLKLKTVQNQMKKPWFKEFRKQYDSNTIK
jgi:hypothetical protein